VENQGTVFLGGPPLVKAATGEIVSAEELGGGKVHTEISGVCDYLAKDEYDAFKQVRSIFGELHEKFDFLPNSDK
jgi:3-methylcrotonyl-CoA carboxylase beta subunit